MGAKRVVAACAFLLLAAPAAAQANCDEPGDRWQRVAPERERVDAPLLRSALDFAHSRQSFAVAVFRNGCLIGEDRLASATAATPMHGWSASKAVTSMLAGRAMALGLLSPEDPVGAIMPEADQAHGAIRVRDLLTQSSGLRSNSGRDLNFFMHDRVRDALTTPLDYAPGTRFIYGETSVALLAGVVERAVGEPLQAFAQRELFGPVGIKPGAWRWWTDDVGNTLGAFGLNMRVTDWARLGELMRRGGVWNGRRLLSDSYVRDAITSSATNPGYGYLFWLSAKAGYIPPDVFRRQVRKRRFIESTPPDTFIMAGFLDQQVTTIPSLGLVVVRMGLPPHMSSELEVALTAADSGEFEHEFYRRLLRAVSDVRVPDPGPYVVDRVLPPLDLDSGIFESLKKPLDALDGAIQPALPPAGPQRARAVQLEDSARLSPGGRVRLGLRCPAAARMPCEGTATLAARRVDRAVRFTVAAGQRAVLSAKLGRSVMKAKQLRVQARSEDAAGGVPVARTIPLH